MERFEELKSMLENVVDSEIESLSTDAMYRANDGGLSWSAGDILASHRWLQRKLENCMSSKEIIELISDFCEDEPASNLWRLIPN